MLYISELLRADFAIRALLVGTLVSTCSAVLGVNLVLKRFSMIGDGLSHAGFGVMGTAVMLGFTTPLIAAAPIVVLAAFFLLRISTKGDAAIAVISSSSIAIGVIAMSRTSGNTDIQQFMFGSILAVGKSDFYASIIISTLILCLYILFCNRMFSVTFDEDFTKSAGVKAGFYNSCLAAMTAVMIVTGIRVMGAMLISGLIVFPALTAMRVFKSYKKVVICAAIVSPVCFNAGIILSYIYDRINGTSTPAGASVVAVNLAVFLIFALAGQLKKSRLFIN